MCSPEGSGRQGGGEELGSLTKVQEWKPDRQKTRWTKASMKAAVLMLSGNHCEAKRPNKFIIGSALVMQCQRILPMPSTNGQSRICCLRS
jgi:hypothetical protein